MLGLFITEPWPKFYIKGMKTWEIRSYPTDYRGDILLIDSASNHIVCKMQLTNCIPLSKERWEMNFDKHRVSCSYESLPYKSNNTPAYAWVLNNPVCYDSKIKISRHSHSPYEDIDSSIVNNKATHPIIFHAERLACKFIGDTMLIYWLKKNYFALVAIVDTSSYNTKIISSEISENELDLIINQLQA